MLAISGDVVIQTLGLVAVALIGSGFAFLSARRSGRTEKEMQPNGGKSMRDQIDLANRRLTTHDERLERMERTVGEIAGTVKAIHARQSGEEETS